MINKIPRVSLCIPTYNRSAHLENCLNSIILCNSQSELKFQVCVSDNNSDDETEDVVSRAQLVINIKYKKNKSNLGIPKNFINVVSMADGEFIWLIGDDDLLMPNAIADLYNLFDKNPLVDFFYVNSYHLNADYSKNYPAPFDIANLPKDMVPFSKWKVDGEMNFLDLINPQISFDFLGGMFLSVFRKKNWENNINILDKNAVQDSRVFSHFDNTFPHVKIFAKAFASSRAYFNSRPLNVCLSGAREWSPMYPLIHSVRLVEALQEYRKNGLPYLKYIYCKNYALNNFIPDFARMYLEKEESGYVYVKPVKLLLEYFLYPNFYFSFFYFIGRRLRVIWNRVIGVSN